LKNRQEDYDGAAVVAPHVSRERKVVARQAAMNPLVQAMTVDEKGPRAIGAQKASGPSLDVSIGPWRLGVLA
jgi:hypothetical protein